MELNDVQKIEAPKLYTRKDVCVFMGVSGQTLYRLVKSGRIKAVNIARAGSKKALFAFRPEDVQAYYDSLQNPPQGPEILNQ